ncbi:MAG: hypothetical protein ACXIVE_14550 [Salinarimonas sp.]
MSTPYSPLGIVPGLGAPTTPQAGSPSADRGAADFRSALGVGASAAGIASPVGNLVAPVPTAPSDTPKTLGAGYDALTPEQVARFRSSYDNLFQV